MPPKAGSQILFSDVGLHIMDLKRVESWKLQSLDEMKFYFELFDTSKCGEIELDQLRKVFVDLVGKPFSIDELRSQVCNYQHQ